MMASDSDLDSSFDEPTEDLLPRIIVKDPVTHSTWEHGKFTSYQICIKTDHPAFHLRLSAVRRRYSELIWLNKVLKANHQYVSFPSLPPKKVLSERFDSEFISIRMKLIEKFLNELLVTDTVLSDTAFHLFLQTDLTTEEMDEYFAGRLSESFIESAWKNVGHVHTSSYVVNMSNIPHEPQEIFMNEEDLRNIALRMSLSDDSFTQSTEDTMTQSTDENANGKPGSSKPLPDVKVDQSSGSVKTVRADIVTYSVSSRLKTGVSTSIQDDDEEEEQESPVPNSSLEHLSPGAKNLNATST